MTLDLMELVVTRAEVSEGRSPRQMAARGQVFLTGVQVIERKSRESSEWQPWEDAYLKANLGYKTEEDIAAYLGRTQVAVHLRWKRDLHLTAPSKDPGVLSALQAAALLGIDGHKLSHWCDVGMIRSRRMRGKSESQERVIRLVDRIAFYRWVVNTDNWIYFDWKQIPDPHLRRLCELQAARWGDEWWDTVQVAKYHSVTTKDVLRLITVKKTLPGVQAATSMGGRHKDPFWLNWFIKRSDALQAEFVRGRGQGTEHRFSARADAWMLKAYKLGWSYEAINRSMGCKVTSYTLSKRIMKLAGKQ